MKALLLAQHAEVPVAPDGFLSLTAIWKAAGSPAHKRPADWLDREAAQEFISYIQTEVAKMPLRSQRGGKAGQTGTWAHVQIALAYAKWLSPQFHAEVNAAYLQLQAEKANPELAVHRAIKGWQDQGKDEAYIEQRLTSIAQRKRFTRTLKEHGCSGDGFRQATNAIYLPLLGGTAEEVRQRAGLAPKANLRDHMSIDQLTATQFAESLASQRIRARGAYGNQQLTATCNAAARNVAKLVQAAQAA